jgi:proteasome lid subunit RPN8/RPN11
MVREPYRFVLELERQDGTPLGQFGVTMDWEPARQWAGFVALRGGNRGSATTGWLTAIEPEWDEAAGQPYVGGVRARLADTTVVVPTTYFRPMARQLSQPLVEKKVLEEGERFHFRVLAFPGQPATIERVTLALNVEDIATSPPLKAARFPEAATSSFGDQNPDDALVVVPQAVLDEAAQMTRLAGANETGGILIGHLCEDDERHDVFIEVTALIPARHALSESTKLTFTAETWAAVDAAIKLRAGGEQMVGWLHSHVPKYWCSSCSAEARRQCPLNRSFFSGEDCSLHRTVFPMGYCVALLVTNTEEGLRYAMFGWRHAILVQRGFHILGATDTSPGELATEAVIGGVNEKTCV